KPRTSQFEFTHTMKISIPIGVVSALIIVSIIIVTVRVYCSRKRNRERRRREKASTPLKMDPPDGCDSDEKNPDVIPLDSDEVEYYRKRQQHISTIDTSPARVTSGGLAGSYCTLRNGGIPLQDLNNIGTRPKYMGGQETGYGTGFVGCPTLPRGHHHGHHGTLTMETGHVSMEWPSYQGAAGISRRQTSAAIASTSNLQTQTPSSQTSLLSHQPQQQQQQQHQHVHQQQQTLVQTQQMHHPTNARLSSFRPPPGSQSQAGMPYDMSPLLQIPVLDEESDLTEMPLMSDKIESTV
ncbi:unnamed protein product, partial [Allacma fusca]